MTGPGTGGFAASTVRLAAARVSSLLAMFALNVLVARVLVPTDVGAVGVGQTIGLFAAMLANGGLNISTVYFLQREPAGRDRLAGGLVMLAIVTAGIAFVLGIAAAPVVFSGILAGPDWPLLLAAASTAAGIIAFEFAGALLLGIDRSGAYSAAEVVRGWSSLAFVVAALLLVTDAAAVVAGMALGYLAAAAAAMAWAGRRVDVRPRTSVDLARRSVAFGLRGQAGNIFQYLGLRLDLLLVPLFAGLGPGGLYFVVVRVAEVVGQMAAAAASLLFPRVAGDPRREATHVTERVVRMTLLGVMAASLAVGLFAEPLLRGLFGDPYAAAAPVLQVTLAAVVPLSLCRLLAADLKGRGRPGLASLGSLVMAVAIVVGDLALIPRFGLMGAAIASLVAYALSAAALAAAYRRVSGGRLSALVPTWTDARAAWALAWRWRAPARVAERG